MGVLSYRCAVTAALVGLTGCYSPSLHDCTVSCVSQHDCFGGQQCGSDGFCASPDVAGRCSAPSADAGAPRDAAIPANDAAPADAATPDAPALISLRVIVIGKGSVVVDGHGICSSQTAQHGDCRYDIASQDEQTVHALSVQRDQVFAGWTTVICGGQGANCRFTPSTATTITAMFVHAAGAR